jgi:transposase InsO family protein
VDNIAPISNHPNVLIERGQTVQSNRATSEARKHLQEYIEFYNTGRSHQTLDYKTPDEVYFVNQVAALAA